MHTYLWERRLLLKPLARALIPEVALLGPWAAPLCRAAAGPAWTDCFAGQQRCFDKIPFPKKISIPLFYLLPPCPLLPYYTCKNSHFFPVPNGKMWMQSGTSQPWWELEPGAKLTCANLSCSTIQFHPPFLGGCWGLPRLLCELNTASITQWYKELGTCILT